MARYPYALSLVLVLVSLIGLYAIGHSIIVGFDAVAWTSFGTMFALAWVARTMITQMPSAARAELRLADAPDWKELSLFRRRALFWFDWQLFLRIRDREAARLLDEPLILVEDERDAVVLTPVEATHTEQYFLEQIARAVDWQGLVAGNFEERVFGRRLARNRVELITRNADKRILEWFARRFSDGRPKSLRVIRQGLESAYLDTLTPDQRADYWRWNR